MLRVLPAFIAIALMVAATIDAAQTPERRIRNLRKGAWIILILVLPYVGPIAWFVAGRPRGEDTMQPTPPRDSGRPSYQQPRFTGAPDDDPEFLSGLKSVNTEHEDMLKKWEADLKRREEELRKPDEPETDSSKPS